VRINGGNTVSITTSYWL